MQVAWKGRRWTAPQRIGRVLLGVTAGFAATVGALRATHDAAAYGDTRTLSLVHAHTNESVTVTFRRNGRYDSEALNQLNWLLRDWRLDEATKMDPRLFDILWEVYRETGSREPIVVLSAYRSPQTNAMLRRRSRAVSEYSQHMAGKAMDFRLTDVDMARVRAIAMRLQHGGVGFYAGAGFVHLDAGSVRSWPRMTHDQLARLFPDGKTVHIPRNGKPFPRYDEARAEILARGGAVSGYAVAGAEDGVPTGRRSLWATLFGGDDEDTEYYRAAPRGRGSLGRNVTAYAPSESHDEGRAIAAFAPSMRAPQSVSRAEAASAKDPVEPAPPPAARAQEPLVTAAFAPVPPRRPDELAIFANAVPIPPARPVELAMAAALAAVPPPAPKAVPTQDDRTALRALFVAAVTNPAAPPTHAARVATSRARPQPVIVGSLLADLGPALDLGFASTPRSDLTTAAFTGPAVKPLPVLR